MICLLILRYTTGSCTGEHLYSIDEKTGIQALERMEIRTSSPGKFRRLEYEYVRHGTTCLMGAVNVKNGRMEYFRIQPTRTEEDLVAFVEQLCDELPREDKITLLMDQLNTHKSEGLVRCIARRIRYSEDLGKKGSHGILKNMETRMKFLEQEDHRVRVVFTPKHCSWLNPIENWFGTLQKRRLNNTSFSSVQDLESKLKDYIVFANEFLCKPYKWKFKGFVKNKKIAV